MTISALFAMAFVTGLSGAMAPGPFLTVTISMAARRGGHVGPQLVLGHGILELALLLLILLGLDSLLSHRLLLTVVSFAGGVVLVAMGIGTLRGLGGYTIPSRTRETGNKGLHPVLSGVILSLSNPYWYIWWITVATGYLVFAKTLGTYGVITFFAGHIASDLAWFSFVSYGVNLGGRYFNTRVIKGILLVCSLFLVVFGAYFLVKGFRFLQ
jgi:threonine/homoserine/homoserine lactone efflux protein